MRVLALLLAATLSAEPDAGYAERVFQVRSAEKLDGGVVDGGWWLADERMQKVGERIVELENEKKRCEGAVTEMEARPPAAAPFYAALIGILIGASGMVLLLKGSK